MEVWLIVLLSVLLAVFVLMVVLPIVLGIVYRCCAKKVTSEKRLDGKTAIVTGSSGGIGVHMALFLASRGARVILACRNQTKAQGVADRIISETGNTNVVVRIVDLSDLTSVRKFSAEVLAEEEHIHLLVNNGGIILTGEKRTSPQGFELTTATNHYGCFLLTNLLIGKIKSSAPSRIVTTASMGYMLNELNLDDLNYERRPYTNMKAYCQSKLCNVLFTKELSRRLAGTGVTANCVHPGYVATEIFTKDSGARWDITDLNAKVMGITPEQGSRTTNFLCVSETVEGKSGDYYVNCKKNRLYRKGADGELARKLWDISCRDVGLAAEDAMV